MRSVAAAVALVLTAGGVAAEETHQDAAAVEQFRNGPGRTIAAFESEGGKNIPNFMFDGPKGRRSAGGPCQMLTSTWLRVARMIDIDVEKFSVSGAADEFTQWRVCWKLWTLEGYNPWTCDGCNSKLRHLLRSNGESPVPVRREATAPPPKQAVAEKPPVDEPKVSAFFARLSASSDVYNAMPPMRFTSR